MLRLSTSVSNARAIIPRFSIGLRRIANLMLVVGFLASLALPMCGSIIGQARTLSSENRAPAAPPKRLNKFAGEFDAFYADRVGCRRELLRFRNSLLLSSFGESPSPLVIFGEDDWLFLNTGFDPLDSAGSRELAIEANAAAIRERAKWCRARGIQYVVQVARDKHMIYPQYLPKRLRNHTGADPVPLLQSACPDVTILDPRARLYEDSRQYAVYHRFDTHWTTRGILVGYRQLAEHLEQTLPGFHGKQLFDFTPHPDCKSVNDLARMAGLPPEKTTERIDWYHQPGVKMQPEPTDELNAIRGRLIHLEVQAMRSPSTNGIHLLMLHDSFGVTFRDYLAGDVSRFTAIGTYGFPKQWIEANQPMVVVQQFVDRCLLARYPVFH